MSQFLYSIVIPHYNSPLLLQRMLDSIPQRDDIQVIVVDDCSTADNIEQLKQCHHSSLEIVYLSENHGPGYARNIGIGKANCKWLLNVDADDLFAEKAFDIFDKYSDSNLDFLNYCVLATDKDLHVCRKIVSDQIVRQYIQKKDSNSLLQFRYLNSVCWNKLVNMEFIKKNNIRFDETFVTDDIIFNLIIGLKAQKFEVISDELYIAVENRNSITHQNRSLEREFLFFLQVQKRNGFFEKLGLKRYPFYRRTILYFPYLWKKRGLSDAFKFFKMIRNRKAEIDEARKAYLYLFE